MATEVMNAPEGRIIHKTYAVLSGAAIPQRVYVTQYDESLPVIACTLYKDGQLYTIPDGASVRLRMNKNGLPVYHEAMGIDNARHVVYLEITTQMTVLYGEFAMVIEVETSDGKTAGTSYLRLIVRQNPVQNPELDNIPDYTANSNRLTAEGVKKLQDESSTQQKAIEDKGKNTLESIPADYSALSGKVDENTSGISKLKEDLVDVNSYFETSTKDYVNICSIIRNNTPNTAIGNTVSGVRQFFDFGKNVTLTKIKANIKSDNNDAVVCEIASLDGKIISRKEQSLGTEYIDVQFDFENLVVKEPISVSLYMKNSTLLSYASYGTPFENPNFVYKFPDGTTKLSFKFGQNPFGDAVASDNKQCIVLFIDYSVKEIKAVKDSILENIDETLLISGKSADEKVVGDKIKALENINKRHIIYVSVDGNDENGDGTEENPFATIFHANETITDNSETN